VYSGLFHFSDAEKSKNTEVIWLKCPTKSIFYDQQENNNITQIQTFQKRQNYKEIKQK